MPFVNDNQNAIREATKLRGRLVPPGSARPTPVVQAAKLAGYTVREFTPKPSLKTVSGAVDHDKKVIFVNATENPRRKRFTIAHEIGHAVLHAGQGDRVDYRGDMVYRSDQEPMEREANSFAAELLMPQQVFEALWSAYAGDTSSVAGALDVSKEAVRVRAKILGLNK